MSDTAQLRETLDRMEDRLRMSGDTGIGWSQDWSDTYDAARELLTIREAGALIITPDENGKWPREVVALVASEMSYPRIASEAHERKAQLVLDALRDAMPDGET